jgi:hypothetical protein
MQGSQWGEAAGSLPVSPAVRIEDRLRYEGIKEDQNAENKRLRLRDSSVVVAISSGMIMDHCLRGQNEENTATQ